LTVVHSIDPLGLPADAVPQGDPLMAMGVVDSNIVVEHDSRRR